MIEEKKQTASQMFKWNFFKYSRYFSEGIGATILINIFALSTSLFSMQVYDRVIPTHGISTLTTLAIGVIVIIIFEFILKLVRTSIMDNVTYGLDNVYSRNIYKKLLSVRLDQLPSSVGSLSSQLKSYETIRSFLGASTIFLFVDTPFAIIYIILLAYIGDPIIAIISFSFFITALIIGIILKFRVKKHAAEGAEFSNKRIGELVESIQSIEVIKSKNGSNKFLSRWMRTSKASIVNELSMKHISEYSTYFAGLLQQLGTASIVITGALLVVNGTMTMGALIACSIINGRIMGPVASMPGMFSQMAHAKAALEGIENIYNLKDDYDGISVPLKPDHINGNFRLENISYGYDETVKALNIEKLQIQKGEKVALVGAIGSGKSTLLKLLTGLYSPQEGKIFLDNLNIAHIDKSVISNYIGYMPQDSRLFKGTLRENLLIGIDDPGDEKLKFVCENTGLINLLNNHPMGFDLPIHEGGIGLSVGQRQLVLITRLLITKPRIWLLDEPTASMDGQLEMKTIQVLKNLIAEDDTVVIVSHKPNILSLVDRVIVMDKGLIVMDDNKNNVLSNLSSSKKNIKDQ